MSSVGSDGPFPEVPTRSAGSDGPFLEAPDAPADQTDHFQPVFLAILAVTPQKKDEFDGFGELSLVFEDICPVFSDFGGFWPIPCSSRTLAGTLLQPFPLEPRSDSPSPWPLGRCVRLDIFTEGLATSVFDNRKPTHATGWKFMRVL